MFVHWSTWMIFLSFHKLKKNIGSMYIWYLIGLPSSSIMLSARSVNCFQRRFEFLGHPVSAAGVGVVKAKVDAIKQWLQPTCIKDVHTFLGLANYYRRFVKGFA